MLKSWKKISVYSLSRDIDFTEIEKKSKDFAFTPCTSQSMASFGFVSPFGKDSAVMNMHGNGFILVEARRETKYCQRRSSKWSWTRRLPNWNRTRAES